LHQPKGNSSEKRGPQVREADRFPTEPSRRGGESQGGGEDLQALSALCIRADTAPGSAAGTPVPALLLRQSGPAGANDGGTGLKPGSARETFGEAVGNPSSGPVCWRGSGNPPAEGMMPEAQQKDEKDEPAFVHFPRYRQG
jgi:hypothetical protein